MREVKKFGADMLCDLLVVIVPGAVIDHHLLLDGGGGGEGARGEKFVIYHGVPLFL